MLKRFAKHYYLSGSLMTRSVKWHCASLEIFRKLSFESIQPDVSFFNSPQNNETNNEKASTLSRKNNTKTVSVY